MSEKKFTVTKTDNSEFTVEDKTEFIERCFELFRYLNNSDLQSALQLQMQNFLNEKAQENLKNFVLYVGEVLTKQPKDSDESHSFTYEIMEQYNIDQLMRDFLVEDPDDVEQQSRIGKLDISEEEFSKLEPLDKFNNLYIRAMLELATGGKKLAVSLPSHFAGPDLLDLSTSATLPVHSTLHLSPELVPSPESPAAPDSSPPLGPLPVAATSPPALVTHPTRPSPPPPKLSGLSPPPPPVDPKFSEYEITEEELQRFAQLAQSKSVKLPNSPSGQNQTQNLSSLKAFFNDPYVNKEIKNRVREKFGELSKAKPENVSGIKKQLEVLLNFPGFGLARDERADKLDEIILAMVAAANDAKSNQQNPDAAAKLILEEEMKRIDEECAKRSSGVERLKERFKKNYEAELMDKYEFRFKHQHDSAPYPPKSYYPPFALDGPPGTGKTSVCYDIAEIFKFGFYSVDMQTITDLNALLGYGTQYAGGGELSKFLKAKYHTATNSVLMLIDEIDRTPDPNTLSAFAGLLAFNSKTSANVRDNFVDADIPAIGMNFIATTNNYYNLKSYLQDRLPREPFPGYSIAEKIKIIDKWLQKIQDDPDIKPAAKDYIKRTFYGPEGPDLKEYLVVAYSYKPGVRILTSAFDDLIKQMKRNAFGATNISSLLTVGASYIDEHGVKSYPYIDDAVKTAAKKLTPEQQSIVFLADQFETEKKKLDDRAKLLSQEIRECQIRLLKAGDQLISRIDGVLDPSYLRGNDSLDKDTDYKNYLNELRNYASYETLSIKNKFAKEPLKGYQGEQYLGSEQTSKIQERLNKITIKKDLLKERLKAIDLKIMEIESRKEAHNDDERTLPLITNLQALSEQKKLIEERIEFAEARIRAVKALAGQQQLTTSTLEILDKNLINLAEKRDKLIGIDHQPTDPNLYTQIDKKIKNLQILIQKLRSGDLEIVDDHSKADQPSSSYSPTSSLGSSASGSSFDESSRATAPPPGRGSSKRPSSPTVTVTGDSAAERSGGWPYTDPRTEGLVAGALGCSYQPVGPPPRPTASPARGSVSDGSYTPISSSPLSFSAGASGVTHRDPIGSNKKWVDIPPPTEPPIPVIPPQGSKSSFCAYMDVSKQEVDLIGSPPEPRQFIVNKASNNTTLYAKLNVMDGEMIEQMIIKRNQTNEGQPIYISGLCASNRESGKNDAGIARCEEFLRVCQKYHITCRFDEDTLNVIKKLRPELLERLQPKPSQGVSSTSSSS